MWLVYADLYFSRLFGLTRNAAILEESLDTVICLLPQWKAAVAYYRQNDPQA